MLSSADIRQKLLEKYNSKRVELDELDETPNKENAACFITERIRTEVNLLKSLLLELF
jgi:hypothetical protein